MLGWLQSILVDWRNEASTGHRCRREASRREAWDDSRNRAREGWSVDDWARKWCSDGSRNRRSDHRWTESRRRQRPADYSWSDDALASKDRCWWANNGRSCGHCCGCGFNHSANWCNRSHRSTRSIGVGRCGRRDATGLVETCRNLSACGAASHFSNACFCYYGK